VTETATSVPSSPIAVVGTITVLLAFVLAAWCVVAGIAGNARKNRRLVLSAVYGLYAFAALAGLAAALIIYAFVTHDFAIKYVAMTSDTSMSTWYKITAFWGGLDGSLLFWVVVLALFSTVAIKSNFSRHRDMIGYVVATIMVVQVFFLALLVFGKNPFSTYLTTAPPDGQGLNPLLQNYWMVIHPPSLYIGFVAATIPFAFGMGALASGRLDDMWLASVRSWMLICFFFLGLGLILGGRWAYEELGWGGYWAWDPVENAGLLPWFTATAFLHSIIIQEQRGMFKRWNLVLVILTFFLTIVGTWMTRSGVVQSVHAFGQDNELALQFIVFMLFILVVSFGLLQYRANKLVARAEFESFVSREYSFLLNNWILLGCAGFVFFATMFPTISEALDGERVSVGPAFFDKIMTPIGLALLFLAGAAPLLAWRRSTRERLINQFALPIAAMTVTVLLLVFVFTGARKASSIVATLTNFGLCAFVITSIGQEFWRGVSVRRKQTGSDPLTSLTGLVLSKRRKYGGYIVHLGIAVLFIGFAGKAYETMVDRTIEAPAFPGRKAAEVVGRASALPADHPSIFMVKGYKFVYEDLVEHHDDNKSSVTARVTLWRGNKKLATMHPARWDFHRGEQPTTEVAIEPQLRNGEDVYLVLTGFDAARKLANFRIYINPLINWVWIGYLLLAFGTLIALVPNRLVESLSPRPKTRLGRAADVGALVLLVAGLLAATASVAVADAPGPDRDAERAGATVGAAEDDHGTLVAQGGPPAEHEAEQTAFSSHNDSAGHAHRFRPRNPTEQALMKELVCMCGGCKRENLYECKCAYAAQEREKVQMLMDQFTASGLTVASASSRVVSAFIKEYGGQHVLSTPRSKATWLVPAVAAIGGLGILLALGRRWVARGQKKLAAAPAALVEDETYADRLDDELRETD
jgi:cytochrome c-type biogenesis protein CcmF